MIFVNDVKVCNIETLVKNSIMNKTVAKMKSKNFTLLLKVSNRFMYTVSSIHFCVMCMSSDVLRSCSVNLIFNDL